MDINFGPSQQRFCNDAVPLQSGSCHEPLSINQTLVGQPQPKTTIQPIIVAPSHDLDVWKTSDLTYHSHVNKSSHFDSSRSGYDCQPDCPEKEVAEHFSPVEMAHRDWDVHHHLSWPSIACVEPPKSASILGEPIQSNLGISQVLEFEEKAMPPRDDDGWLNPSRDQFYDPRFTGYGTFYRAFWNEEKSTPDYFYRDVDQVGMPVIYRSKIDTFPWATTSDDQQIRLLANHDFMQSSLVFRNEMQDRLMRKRNAEWWQRRVAPLTTMVK